MDEINNCTVQCKYKQWIVVSGNIRVKFQSTGYIPGSAFVEVELVYIKKQ